MKSISIEATPEEKGVVVEEVRITHVAYHVFPGTSRMVCCLTLSNGEAVIGEAPYARPEDMAKKEAQRDAMDRLTRMTAPIEVTESVAVSSDEEALADREAVIESTARIAHEVNRAYCLAFGDTSQLPWDMAPDWQRQSAVDGVRFHIANPEATPAASHENWLATKVKDGWKHGPVKDAEKKEHPCMLPFDALPVEQRTKDYLFQAVVHALLN